MATRYFPYPYPDEIFGSIVIRAGIHLGLRPKTLIRQILQRQDGQLSFFLPADLSLIAELTHQTPEVFLTQHTIFPYVTAFLPSYQKKVIAERILRPCKGTKPMLSSLVKSITHSMGGFRYCRRCMKADISSFGESYWHRCHLLPGVCTCPSHRIPLIEVNSHPIGKSRFDGNLPHMVLCRKAIDNSSETNLWDMLATISEFTFSPQWPAPTTWADVYKLLAIENGYRYRLDKIAGTALASDIEQAFSNASLAALGCSVSGRRATSWPALMMRKHENRTPFSPIKHILLLSFLLSCECRTTPFNYIRPGKKSPDFASLDLHLVSEVKNAWRTATERNLRVSVESLITSKQYRPLFKRKRRNFPFTKTLIDEFKTSAQAIRQIGRRPRILHKR